MPTALTIGRIAKLAEVNIETVRYYERRGLLPSPPRPANCWTIIGRLCNSREWRSRTSRRSPTSRALGSMLRLLQPSGAIFRPLWRL